MTKDFQGWHDKKSDIHENKTRVFFHQSEIWFASVGLNIGFEQDGQGDAFLRPVLVIKKFSNDTLWCLSLTRSTKKNAYHYPFSLNSEVSTVILSQLRLIDAKRLQYKIGDLPEKEFGEVKEKLRQFLA